MKSNRMMLTFFLIAIMSIAGGCSGGSEDANSVETTKKDDGSVLSVSQPQPGYKVESRSFPTGEIEKVERITRPNGGRQVLVYFRDNPSGTKGLTDPAIIERAMEASPEEIKQAAGLPPGSGGETGK